MYQPEHQLIVKYTYNRDSEIIYNKNFVNAHLTNIFDMKTLIIWCQKSLVSVKIMGHAKTLTPCIEAIIATIPRHIYQKVIASSGNRTRAARVTGEHSTTEPTMPWCNENCAWDLFRCCNLLPIATTLYKKFTQRFKFELACLIAKFVSKVLY